jgi:hypothetical protein
MQRFARDILMQHLEDLEQAALFERLAWELPDVLAFHIPNGGKRSPREATRLKAQGVKPGIPDICIPMARNGYHGLYIELKRPIIKGESKPITSKIQNEMIGLLINEGYYVEVCYGADEAFKLIKDYINSSGKFKKITY